MCYNKITMESINKNMPLISCIIGFSILFFSILHFIGGVRTELKADMAEVKSELKADMTSMETRLNARMDRMETRLNARMDQMETNIQSMETNIKSINSKLDQLLQAQRKPASSKITKKPKKASS